MSLKRVLGGVAVAAVVAGNMLGSGIFFTPGELAAVAQQNWQIYFFWTLSGLITLCGALTLAELSSTIPESGSTFHIIREAFGEFWGFLKIWVEMLVSGPGSVAGLAIAFGTYFSGILQLASSWAPSICGSVAILFFAAINILGIQWGGRTQITLTTVKILALLALVLSSFLFVSPQAAPDQKSSAFSSGDLFAILRFIGLGIAIVLYTYDGWVDVTHTAGEISDPRKNLPRGLILGVCIIIVLYVLVNHAFLRAVPLEKMKENPGLVGVAVAEKSFGPQGGKILQWVIMTSIFGSLGGLMMTLPRLYYGAASHSVRRISSGTLPHRFFHMLSVISPTTSTPVASILFCAIVSVLALLFFRSFAKIVNFFCCSTPIHQHPDGCFDLPFSQKNTRDIRNIQDPGLSRCSILIHFCNESFFVQRDLLQSQGHDGWYCAGLNSHTCFLVDQEI